MTKLWGNKKGEIEGVADIQNAELWGNGEYGFSTIDIGPTRNKWNESKWFDWFVVLVIAGITTGLCFTLGWV